MNKKIVLPLLLIVLAAALFFIPVNQEKTVSVNAPFLNVFTAVFTPNKWVNWQASLRKATVTDSGKITFQKQRGRFTIKYDSLLISVKQTGTRAEITQTAGTTLSHYTYDIVPGTFDKKQGNTEVIASREVSLFGYLKGLLGSTDFSDSHIDDIKTYFETDSLLYGFKVFKNGVPEADLIEVSKLVLKKDKFTTAAALLADLQAYVKKNNIKQMQPLIAQFLRKGTDSTKVNVGFFIDRQVKPDNIVHYVRMPLGGALYVAAYHGPFNKRQKVYNALDQYFTDHLYTQAIVPFEMYLDNKLPTSDTSKVNIRLNYTAYY